MTTVTFTANDTWVVPAGVTEAQIECWSGGIGGQNKDPGAGGTGGRYARGNAVVLTPAETLTVNVGAGGAPDGWGGDTYVARGATPLVKASLSTSSIGDAIFNGGSYGRSGGGAGGGGGSSAGTSGNGNAGSPGAGGIGGAGGVAPVGGWAGGKGGDDTKSGSNAPSYAGGGGGAGDGNGGFGGPGIVKITYEEPVTVNGAEVIYQQSRLIINGPCSVRTW